MNEYHPIDGETDAEREQRLAQAKSVEEAEQRAKDARTEREKLMDRSMAHQANETTLEERVETGQSVEPVNPNAPGTREKQDTPLSPPRRMTQGEEEEHNNRLRGGGRTQDL